MEEYLAKAESDNLLNSERERSMNRQQQFQRLRHITNLEVWLTNQFIDAEPLVNGAATMLQIQEHDMVPVLVVMKKYNPEVAVIQDYEGGVLDVEAGTLLYALIKTMKGITEEKFLLMECLCDF